MEENTLSNTRTGQNVGARVNADQLDSDRLTYSLKASADNDVARGQAALFDIDPSTGQIRTKKLLSHEDSEECGYISTDDPTACIYTVVVEVRDNLNSTGSLTRMSRRHCHRDDRSAGRGRTSGRADGDSDGARGGCGYNPRSALGRPREHGGRPFRIYVQYRTGSGAFPNDNDNCDSTGEDNCDNITNTMTTITGLDADTSYSVQVRAREAVDEGAGAWSRTVTVKTNKSDNNAPIFGHRHL